MTLPNGYTFISSFPMDFSIADFFGPKAVEDTFNRAFNEWKSNNYVYFTELVITLNWKIWEHYQRNPELAKLYNELWEKADSYAMNNLKGKELEFFLKVTD
jgi:hypothetical protein